MMITDDHSQHYIYIFFIIPARLPYCGVTVAEEEVTLLSSAKVSWGEVVLFYNLVLLATVMSLSPTVSQLQCGSSTWPRFVCCLCFLLLRMFSCLVFLRFLLGLENYLKIPLQVVYTENIHYTLRSKLVWPASSFAKYFQRYISAQTLYFCSTSSLFFE